MLSEMCISEDFSHPLISSSMECDEAIDRSVLSAIGSALTTPIEEFKPAAIGLGCKQKVQATVNSPGPDGLSHMSELTGAREQRPRIVRISTSQTQIFTPGDEGVEVDGLPVGPGKEVWKENGKGKRREKSLL
jgi:hypothetical protein